MIIDKCSCLPRIERLLNTEYNVFAPLVFIYVLDITFL